MMPPAPINLSDLVILQRLLLITVIAGAIGFERERHGRAAGFRTHILVGVGSCLVMMTGLFLMGALANGMAVDPSRMAAQVISGIGFLGAGTILRSRGSIRGLTTAASLWAVGGVGLAVGAGFVRGAMLTGIVVMLVLFALSPLERSIRKEQYQTLVVMTAGGMAQLAAIRELLADYELEIRDLDLQEGEGGQTRLEVQVRMSSDQPRQEIIKKLRALERTVEAYWA